MALGNYKIKVVPVLDTASLHKQLEGAGVSTNLKKAGASAGQAYSKGLFTAIKERAKYSVANALIYGSINAMKDMVANVRELDKAQVELKKVTDLSGKSLEKYTEQAYKMSGAVAKTGTEIIQASTEFAKQGFDPQTALQLSNVASQFQNIADTEIDAATAAKFINSQLKAFGNTDYFSQFNTDAEKATAVIDAVNEVANNFGVGTNDLQMALTKTSAAMKGYGNTYSETIGLITAGTEVMPNQASKVARGWRTIGANILKLAQDTDTLESANGKVSVALKDSNGELRSTFQILQDLYPQWKTLNSEERSALALSLAGKTQTEVFQATMDNFTHAIEANETAMNSQGSAARENAKYLDSIQGRVKAFQSAWEQLSYHIISSDLIKNVVSFGTKIITVIDNVVQGIGALPTALGLIATAFGALKLTKLIPQFLGLSKAVEEVVVAENALTTASTGAVAAEEAMATASGGSLLSRLASLGSALLPLAPALIALGGAFIYANHQYNNSFKGKLEEYKKLGDEIENIKSQIDELESKEGSLTSEEESRLSILKMQLQVLQQQEALKSKQLTHAFDKDAKEKMHGKTHMEQGEKITEREDTVGEKYLKATEKRFALQKKIKHLEDESRKHPLTEEQTKSLEKYNKELDKVYDNEYNALDKLIKAEEELANVDYSKLSTDGKAYYDNIHSAYVQATSDIEEVRNAVGQTIDLFGSAQFDSWEIDVSSLKSASELADQITAKISELDDEEDITIYARDETGNIIDEITRKKGDLTDEEWELVVNATTTGDYDKLQEYIDQAPEEKKEILFDFIPVGASDVEAQKEQAAKDTTSTVHIQEQGSGDVEAKKNKAASPVDAWVSVKDGGTASKVQGSIDGIHGKDVHINIFKTIWESIKKKAKGKRKGEEGGMSWLGDEGSRANPKPELVVGEDGAYLAGTDGWELRNLKSSDTVYTASQTKRLLSDGDFDIASVELPRFKKGKKQTKQQQRKAVQKKASQKTKEKWEKEFNKKLDELKHKSKVNHWTDAKFQEEYKKLYDKYYTKATKDQLWDYTESHADYLNEQANENFDRRIGNVAYGANVANLIADIKKNANLSADEKIEAEAKAYKASVEYNMKEYKAGKNTRSKIVEDIKNYYKTRGKYDEEYYKMVEELREADRDKEIERLKELGKAQEDKLSLAQKYLNKELDAIEKQIDAQKEEEENAKKLAELQNDLNKAKSQTIKIYKEGVGFVYEQDTEAIQEAQQALDEYTSSQTKSELEQRAEQIREILELFKDLQDESDIHELAMALGVGNLSQLTGGNLGTDIGKWTQWIKGVIAGQIAYEDLAEQLGNVASTDLYKWLGDTLSGGTHQIGNSTISEYISKHSFAGGTLSAPGGLSRVAEGLGGELIWLGKGDSVYSNAVSKNLMEWGRYSPAQILNSSNGNNQMLFNFDKIVLPNVHNANDFYRELQTLPNKALQKSTKR